MEIQGASTTGLSFWQESMDIVQETYRIATGFPGEENSGPGSQVKTTLTYNS